MESTELGPSLDSVAGTSFPDHPMVPLNLLQPGRSPEPSGCNCCHSTPNSKGVVPASLPCNIASSPDPLKSGPTDVHGPGQMANTARKLVYFSCTIRSHQFHPSCSTNSSQAAEEFVRVQSQDPRAREGACWATWLEDSV